MKFLIRPDGYNTIRIVESSSTKIQRYERIICFSASEKEIVVT